MSNELKNLSRLVASGRMDRRAFLSRAAAMGVSAGLANTMLSTAAMAATPKKGGTLKAGLQGGESTDSLDPGSFDSSVPLTFGRAWGETLGRVDKDGNIQMRLAEEMNGSDGGKTWTIKVRKGVEFHNGKTVTAEDVAATIGRHADEKSKSGAHGIMKGIESIKASGDDVVLTLGTANADMPFLLCDYHLIVQPGGGVDNPSEGISAGPYKVEVDAPGVRHTAVRNENYWSDDLAGNADSIEITVMNDATARTAALQSGQVHMINRIEPKVVSLINRLPGITVRNVSGRGHYVFIMHTNTAPFDNKDLRLALKYGIDRQELVDKILFGYGSVGNDIPINASYPLFSDHLPQREYDADKAAFHLKKSGHEGPIVLRTSDVAFPGAVDASQLFQQSAQKAGIDLQLKREPGDGYWSDVWNKQPFCASYWGGRPVQDQMYSTAYLSGADWNDTRFNNTPFDDLIINARAELDLAKRKQMYADAATILHEDGGLICPMFNDFIDAVSDRVGGWVEDPNGELLNGYALVDCWFDA